MRRQGPASLTPGPTHLPPFVCRVGPASENVLAKVPTFFVTCAQGCPWWWWMFGTSPHPPGAGGGVRHGSLAGRTCPPWALLP